MNFKKQIQYFVSRSILIILGFITTGMVLKRCQDTEKQIQNAIQINERYLLSYKLNDNNPFEEPTTYEVKVSAIKDGFVQFELDEGGSLSCSIEQFLRISTEIKSVELETTLYDTTPVQRYKYKDGGTGTHPIDWETGEKGTPIN